jgi:hypothetical protein
VVRAAVPGHFLLPFLSPTHITTSSFQCKVWKVSVSNRSVE